MPGDFRERALRGTGWVALSTWVLRLSGLATFAVLGRLLLPAEIGTAALALGVAGFVAAVLDLGFGTYLVRSREVDEDDVATAFWLVLAQAVAATALVLVLAEPLAAALGEPGLAPVLRAVAPVALLTAPAAVPTALLLRDLAMRPLALREVVAGLVGAVVGVSAALAGAGVWSIVAQTLAQTVVATGLVLALHPWRPRLRFSRPAAVRMARFGLPLLGTSLVQQLRDRVDQFLLGAVAGTTVLGYWAVATRILAVVAQATISVLDQVGLPVFARSGDDDRRLARTFSTATAYATLALGPAVAAVGALSPVLLPLLFGPQWGPSVVPAQLLCAAYGVGALSYFARAVYLTRGRTGLDLALTAVALVVHVVVVVLAGPHGLVVLSAALIGESVLLLALHALVLRRVVAVGASAWVPGALALGASGAAFGGATAVLQLPGPRAAVVAAAVLAGVVTYTGLVRLLLPALLAEVVRDVRTVLRRRGGGASG
ncbi:lipopolysaccharide biosynthesis protein [Cellulomonas marina]|uniref:lipopolysaccharide biosynthesis protein n=1 Tax=Cellulomonas marina TaxID=988821 RepID=UPI001587EF50|nr:lipopolysaccharide biosynthesis protein [Cellulomonas marina]